MLNPF